MKHNETPEKVTGTTEQANESVAEAVAPESAESGGEVRGEYPVKIVVPAVAKMLGSDVGIFMRNISEVEAEIFVNGEIKVVGVETFVKDEE